MSMEDVQCITRSETMEVYTPKSEYDMSLLKRKAMADFMDSTEECMLLPYVNPMIEINRTEREIADKRQTIIYKYNLRWACYDADGNCHVFAGKVKPVYVDGRWMAPSGCRKLCTAVSEEGGERNGTIIRIAKSKKRNHD